MTGDGLPSWARKAAIVSRRPRPDRPPRPEPPLPSKPRMAGELVKTIGHVVVHAAKTGRVKASEEEQARRWAKCRACDHFRRSDERCGVVEAKREEQGKKKGCGCWLSSAITFEAKHCPIEEW